VCDFRLRFHPTVKDMAEVDLFRDVANLGSRNLWMIPLSSLLKQPQFDCFDPIPLPRILIKGLARYIHGCMGDS
jgi:hypothetical protein